MRLFRTLFLLPLLLLSVRADEYDDLRNRWLDMLTGGSSLDLDDSSVASRITSITNAAIAQRDSINRSTGRTNLWSDAASTTVSADITTNYTRIRTMAIAYATRGSTLQGNTSLRDDILGALDWMQANRYNATKTAYNNWWDWEIGSPQKLNDILVLMYADLGATRLANNLATLDKWAPYQSWMTGANRSDKCLVVAIRGIIGKTASKLVDARDQLSPVFPYVTSSDGFYADGSFIQHSYHPYTGSYGAELIKGVSYLYALLANSTWQITDPACDNVFRWVTEGFAPLYQNGAMMDMVRGRAVSRNGDDHGTGAYILGSILRFARAAPSAKGRPIMAFVKGQIAADTYRNYVSGVPLAQLAETHALLADSSLGGTNQSVAHVRFPSMDRVVHRRPGWAFGLAMSSARIATYESINSENLKGWFTGDGMLTLYNSDLGQYGDGWRPTIDPYHFPGVTADTATRTNASSQSVRPSPTWVGGVDLGEYGSAGMQLAGATNSLVGRKSWFFFDNEVVCLGAGITAGGSSAIHTTVENRKLGSSGNERFTVNGSDQTTSLGWSGTLASTSWCALAGTGGYYFPTSTTIQAKREARTDAWSSINSGQSTTSLTRNFLTLWINHGAAPSNASYSYVILPDLSDTATAAYAAAPDIQILSNTSGTQAVRETTLGLTAANFWNDGAAGIGGIATDRKAAVMVKRTSGTLELAVSDPTFLNTGSITLTLDDSLNHITKLDPAITVIQLSPKIIVSVNVSGARGKTFRAKFSNLSAFADRAETPPGQAVLLDVLGNDTSSAPPLALESASQPSNGTATIIGSAIRYTPDAGFTGTDSFTYTAHDSVDSCTATVTIEVTSGLPTTIPGAVSASTDDGNVPANTLDGSLATRWSALGNPQWIQYDLGGSRRLDATSLAFYLGNTRTSTFDVLVSSDGSAWETLRSGTVSSGGTLDPERFDLTDHWTRFVRIIGHGNSTSLWNSITEARFHTISNQAPTASAIIQHTSEAQAVTFTPLAAATDPDAGPSSLMILSIRGASHGTASILGQAVHYTPAPGFGGTETLTCQISDGHRVTEIPLSTFIDRPTTIPGFIDKHFTQAAITDPLITGLDRDPDADGRSNLIEFALGSDPRSSDSQPPLTLTKQPDGTHLVSVLVRDPATFSADAMPFTDSSGLRYRLQAGSHPDAWGGIVLTETSSPVASALPAAPTGFSYHHFRLPVESPRAFVRLLVQTLP